MEMIGPSLGYSKVTPDGRPNLGFRLYCFRPQASVALKLVCIYMYIYVYIYIHFFRATSGWMYSILQSCGKGFGHLTVDWADNAKNLDHAYGARFGDEGGVDRGCGGMLMADAVFVTVKH